jgi:hypothetical protein
VEELSRDDPGALISYASTAVTEEVYRHQLKPVITRGAETMSAIFNQQRQAKSA